MTAGDLTPHDKDSSEEINTKELSLSVEDVIENFNEWLGETRKLFKGPVDVTFMALGTLLIILSICARVVSKSIWQAPEFLGLISVASLLFLLATLERILMRPPASTARELLDPVREELKKASEPREN